MAETHHRGGGGKNSVGIEWTGAACNSQFWVVWNQEPVCVEMSISASSNDITVLESLNPLPWFTLNSDLYTDSSIAVPEGGLRQVDARWELSFEWDALQPQRTRALKPLFIVFKSETRVEFAAKVFADNFAEPVVLRADLAIEVRKKKVSLADLVPNIESLKDEPNLYSTFKGSLTP